MEAATHEAKLQQAYRDALQVQDACNLSGVVFSWVEHMQTICDEAQRLGMGTDWKNAHPVNVLFASKVASLTGCEVFESFGKAYDEARQISKVQNG